MGEVNYDKLKEEGKYVGGEKASQATINELLEGLSATLEVLGNEIMILRSVLSPVLVDHDSSVPHEDEKAQSNRNSQLYNRITRNIETAEELGRLVQTTRFAVQL